jgi:hypothetical protein
MREIGAVLQPGSPPDPDSMREIYARHASRLLPYPKNNAPYAAESGVHAERWQCIKIRRKGQQANHDHRRSPQLKLVLLCR